jgi:hypothetical protein
MARLVVDQLRRDELSALEAGDEGADVVEKLGAGNVRIVPFEYGDDLIGRLPVFQILPDVYT